jgi:hypothetical protein
MGEKRPPAYDVTTERAIKHLFPEEAKDAVTLNAEQEGTPAAEAERAVKVSAEQRESSAKDDALRRLREAPGGGYRAGAPRGSVRASRARLSRSLS